MGRLEVNCEHKSKCWYCGKENRVFQFHHICHFHITCWIKVLIKYKGNVDQWLWDNSEFIDEDKSDG